MPKPSLPDLFAEQLDGFQPIQGNGPRLWIRRLVIWRAADEPPIRDISLRPGLNIVWSPDAEGEDGHMGHGGGKTSFCRLIRYCLGEDSYGADAQRQRIANSLPDAHVGAEIMLDGELWNVIRPIGAGAGTGRHYAQAGGSLDGLAWGDLPNSTISPLRKAIASAVMPAAAPHMPVGSSLDDAWEATLAWLTRDQECRLLDILDWRAPETQSRSPSRNMSKPDRVRVIRLLLKALQQDEIGALRRAQEHKRRAEEAARRKQRIEWVRDDVARDLADIFGGDPAEATTPDFWAVKATAGASAEQLRADPEIDQRLQEAATLVAEKEGGLRSIEDRLIEIDAALPEVLSRIRMFDDQIPRAALSVEDASDPLCPTCGQSVPPEAQTFIDQQQAFLESLREDHVKAIGRRQALLAEQQSLKPDLGLARQRLEQAKATHKALEQAAAESREALASATGYVTLTKRYPEYLAEITKHEAEFQHETAAEVRERSSAAAMRLAAQGVVARLSALFGATVSFLVPEGAEASVQLNESGIQPIISLHGDLTTAAVDSLKVVAFDLAALLLTMEGKTELPGFWLHDSPREADLGLAIYHRIFDLALWLEEQTDGPQFQYIVTTTTAPPEKLKAAPWTILKLSSAPRESRLLRRDL
ncbi:hypothetical protein Q9Q95_21015 [Sphingomonas sp. DG1-23]|uniref:hypothetical protein n=1 Tax=Sphingomonas sp. DG1-23 TaxID=3068316 RepID=UPI00273D852C|nr:hypothetical protein [Sphingomonas sp. DG1-23]MDP5281420.1 hypothetical protein [Sphingomonas sp. DG1-23]